MSDAADGILDAPAPDRLRTTAGRGGHVGRDHHGRQRPLGAPPRPARSPATAPGTRALRRTVEAAPELGVRSLAVYAFSTENWWRPNDEVRGLMDLFADTIRDEFPDLHRQGVRVRFVGRRDRCPTRSSS